MSVNDLMTCTYGTTALTIESLEVDEKPIIEKGLGRNGTEVSVAIGGYYVGTSAADLESKLAAAYADLAIDGRNLVVRGLGATKLYELLAARCFEGGPHCEFKAKTNGLLRFDFTITASANKQDDGSGSGGDKNEPTDKFTIKTHTRPDALRVISRGGKLKGTGASNKFLVATYPAWKLAYPLPKWVTEVEYEASTDANQSEVTYTLTATELNQPLPAAGVASFAVDGKYSIQEDRDEQLRLTITHNYDLLVSGDLEDLLKKIRPATEAIMRESVTRTQIEENRLRASFTILKSASGTPLMNLTQSVSAEESQLRAFDIVTYPGADPIIKQKPKGVQKITQTGSVTCVGQFLKPAKPIFTTRLAPDVITYEHANDLEKRTNWTYTFFASNAGLPIEDQLENLFKPQMIDRDSLDLKPASFYPAGNSPLDPPKPTP